MSEELREDKLIDINEESICGQKYEDLPEEVSPTQHLTLKEFSEIFHNIENTKDKMLEVDSNLEGM